MSGSSNVGIDVDEIQTEDPEKLAQFQATIDAGHLIELDEWMPAVYRSSMLKMAEHHANSEIVGALPEGEWITRAPSLRRKLALTAKVQDEVGHGQMLYRVSQDLGKTRDAMLRLTKGWDRVEIEKIVEEALEEVVAPLVYAEALFLIDEHM